MQVSLGPYPCVKSIVIENDKSMPYFVNNMINTRATKGEFIKKWNVVDDFGLKCSNISLTTMSKRLKIFPIQKTFITLATIPKIGTVAC